MWIAAVTAILQLLGQLGKFFSPLLAFMYGRSTVKHRELRDEKRELEEIIERKDHVGKIRDQVADLDHAALDAELRRWQRPPRPSGRPPLPRDKTYRGSSRK